MLETGYVTDLVLETGYVTDLVLETGYVAAPVLETGYVAAPVLETGYVQSAETQPAEPAVTPSCSGNAAVRSTVPTRRAEIAAKPLDLPGDPRAEARQTTSAQSPTLGHSPRRRQTSEEAAGPTTHRLEKGGTSTTGSEQPAKRATLDAVTRPCSGSVSGGGEATGTAFLAAAANTSASSRADDDDDQRQTVDFVDLPPASAGSAATAAAPSGAAGAATDNFAADEFDIITGESIEEPSDHCLGAITIVTAAPAAAPSGVAEATAATTAAPSGAGGAAVASADAGTTEPAAAPSGVADSAATAVAPSGAAGAEGEGRQAAEERQVATAAAAMHIDVDGGAGGGGAPDHAADALPEHNFKKQAQLPAAMGELLSIVRVSQWGPIRRAPARRHRQLAW